MVTKQTHTFGIHMLARSSTEYVTEKATTNLEGDGQGSCM